MSRRLKGGGPNWVLRCYQIAGRYTWHAAGVGERPAYVDRGLRGAAAFRRAA